jgi:hypothetical protein
LLIAIDHVIIASADPDHDAQVLEDRLGLRSTGGGRHDEPGTFNRLIWLGNSYLELVGVFDRERAMRHWWGAHVADILATRTGGYEGISLASDDLDREIESLRRQGSELMDAIEGQRVRPDGDVVRWRLARLPEPDPQIGSAFIIEHDPAAAEWRPPDREARAVFEHPLGTRAVLERVEFSVDQVARALPRLHRHLGLTFRPSLAGGGARDATIGAQTLRIRRLISSSPPTIVIRGGSEPREAVLFGCNFVIEPSRL